MKKKTQRGFTLLELLVAFAIMGIALGLLYRATGGSARNAGEVERVTQASELAESLLALHDALPPGGWNEAGQSAGFFWSARSAPYPTPVTGSSSNNNNEVPPLHEVALSVRWDDGAQQRSIDLVTLLPERKPPPGAVVR